MARLTQDQEAQKALARTLELADMKCASHTILYVGGHDPMWALVDNPDSTASIEAFYDSGKLVAAARTFSR